MITRSINKVLNTADNEGRTPLHLAALMNRFAELIWRAYFKCQFLISLANYYSHLSLSVSEIDLTISRPEGPNPETRTAESGEMGLLGRRSELPFQLAVGLGSSLRIFDSPDGLT